MARFVLQPCGVREDRFVLRRKEEPVEFDWPSLRAKFVPSGSRAGQANLCRLEPMMYVGLIRTRRGIGNFILQNQGRNGMAAFMLRKDPFFLERVEEVYRVEEADYGHRCAEYT